MMQIQSKSHPYEVREATSLADALRQAAAGQRTFALVDSQVHAHYPSAAQALDSENVRLIEATEPAKSLDALSPTVEWLLRSGFRRDCLLLVVGGGVLQDLGCFIASVLFRGVRWSLVPTTLLAQCDSCIGSKSSINVGHFKNQLGTFYPPHQVLMAFDVLGSLPPDEIRSGLGEIIKLHLIDGEAAVSRLRGKLARYASEPAVLSEMVWDSLTIKKRFIEEDEYDKGIRNLLNYGHTFGHAYESATDYAIPHGIAVTLGVLTATFLLVAPGLGDGRVFRDTAPVADALLRPVSGDPAAGRPREDPGGDAPGQEEHGGHAGLHPDARGGRDGAYQTVLRRASQATASGVDVRE